jgi:hypothetical protein
VKIKVKIELFEEHEKVNFYTLRIEDEDTEIEKFFNKFPSDCEFDEDIQIIIRWIDKIGSIGALERYFRPEGKYSDNVSAIPIEISKVRLYLLRISESIIILGNGDIKTTKTYNEDFTLSHIVELLQSVDRFIKSRLDKGSLAIKNRVLKGKKTFYY